MKIKINFLIINFNRTEKPLTAIVDEEGIFDYLEYIEHEILFEFRGIYVGPNPTCKEIVNAFIKFNMIWMKFGCTIIINSYCRIP